MLFPSAASAQTDSDDIDAILGLEPAPQAPGPTAPANAVPTLGNTNAPETYVVRYGDTLWDLCARFLNNPWYWPKIWSYNGGLDNPHWIRPGTVLRFYPQSDEAPVVVVSVPEDGNVNPAGENGAGLDIDDNTFLDAPQARPGSTRGPVQDINMSDFELQTGEEPALGFEPLPLFEAAEGMTERLERIPDSNVTKRRVTVFVEDEIPLQAGTLKMLLAMQLS